jgi:hypothetical protein
MPVKTAGNTALTVVSVSRTFDPQSGYQATIIYQGFEAACNTIVAASGALGAKGRSDQFAGPVYRASITFGDAQDGAAEVPVDRWERVTEYVQEPLANNSNVIQAAGDSVTLAGWLAEIKKDLAKDNPVGLDAGAPAAQQALYTLMAQKITSHELKRFVLRRRRTISLTYAAVAVANAVETIYTTQKLAQVFGVPNSIYTKLPANPNYHPPGTAWSWKERADNSIYTPAYNKSEEIKDWVFAPWSTLLYNLQGAPPSEP